MKLLLIPVVLAALGQAGGDAEKRFQAMEAKIAKANTVQVTFDSKVESTKANATIKGTLAYGGAGKRRIVADADTKGKVTKIQIVSDGTNEAVSVNGQAMPAKPARTTEMVRHAVTAMLARSGVGLPLMRQGKQDDKEDPLKTVKVSDFKKGKDEKVGGRQATAIDYKMTMGDEKVTLNCTVWVDTQTNLPLKHVLRGGRRRAHHHHRDV